MRAHDYERTHHSAAERLLSVPGGGDEARYLHLVLTNYS